MSVIGGVAGGSKQGRKAAWKFVRDNWEELYNRYQGGFLISRLIKVRGGPGGKALPTHLAKARLLENVEFHL